MEMYKKRLAENLLELRKSRAMSQIDLAEVSGIPRTTLSNFESGSGNPSLANLALLAQSLRVSIEELLSSPKADIQVYSSSDLETETRSSGSVEITRLLPEKIRGLEFEKIHLEAQAHMKGSPHLKGTKEYFYCLKGKILLYIAGEKFEIKAGQLISFSGDQAHAYVNSNKTPSSGISLINLNP